MANLTALSSQIRNRVLAADSTSMTTQLLVEALGRDAQLQMIEAPSSASGILALVMTKKPQIAVISAQIDQNEGFDLVRKIRAQSPATRVIVLLDSSERAMVTEAFRAGARGVFCRTEPFRMLAKCIQCVASGQVWASSSELHYVLEALSESGVPAGLNFDGGLLSARETDVVRCVTEGLTNREIAQRLSLTEHTVKNYLFRIFDKLGVSSRVEVVLYAFRNGKAGPASKPSLARRLAGSVDISSRWADSNPVSIRKTVT
jgi:DNA-binding NarL/FixJ family response regulator